MVDVKNALFHSGTSSLAKTEVVFSISAYRPDRISRVLSLAYHPDRISRVSSGSASDVSRVVRIGERCDSIRAVRSRREGNEDPAGRVARRPRFGHDVLKYATCGRAVRARNFQSTGTCWPAVFTNERPERPDKRSAATGVARPGEPCCTSSSRGTRRRARRAARRRPRGRWGTSLCRARARRVSAVRYPRARLRARALSDLSRRDRGRVQLQAARNLSELHRATHGRHRRASGGSRAAARAIPTVGVHGSQTAAPRARARSGVDELDRWTRRSRDRRVAEARRAQARNWVVVDP